MSRRKISETGCYHITTRSAGQIALFEDDDDRRYYLRLLHESRDRVGARIIARVLMTDHVHLVVDFGESSDAVSAFMHGIDSRYTRYFNAKTNRSGTLFQGVYWSKPILDDAQLVATVHYVHMNPEVAGLSPMRAYHWSSYQEYAGLHWVVDTDLVLGIFGSFKCFDSYVGSEKDVVRQIIRKQVQDGDALALAIERAQVETSAELRALPRAKRNEIIRYLGERAVPSRKIARTFGIGASTVCRILRTADSNND